MTSHMPFGAGGPLDDAFEVVPAGIVDTDSTSRIGAGLGAVLYIRSTEPELDRKLTNAATAGAVACVVCLEDSISDDEVEQGEANVIAFLRARAETGWDHLPLLFLRPRSPGQLQMLAKVLGRDGYPLVGLCLPKFAATNAATWFESIDELGAATGRSLLVMPILEGIEVLAIERRQHELLTVKHLLAERREQVPAVRVGGSDLCGLLGLRRRADQTIYDLGPVSACISDLVNVLAREEDGFVVSGPVWEYFNGDPRVWKPQLREALFDGPFDDEPLQGHAELRSQLISSHFDGLIKEVLADQANGLWGKTVIHPSHIRPVNALQAVTFEEWVDAKAVGAAIQGGKDGGATKSAFANKMNETAPHRRWAERVLERSRTFGVLREGVTFVSLLQV